MYVLIQYIKVLVTFFLFIVYTCVYTVCIKVYTSDFFSFFNQVYCRKCITADCSSVINFEAHSKCMGNYIVAYEVLYNYLLHFVLGRYSIKINAPMMSLPIT